MLGFTSHRKKKPSDDSASKLFTSQQEETPGFKGLAATNSYKREKVNGLQSSTYTSDST